VSYSQALTRIASLQGLMQQVAAPSPTTAAPSSFAGTLAGTSATTGDGVPTSPYGFVGAPGAASVGGPDGIARLFAGSGGSAGERALAVARGELGVAEQPPGSNDGPRIASYRQAVAGASGGAPWCAYFVSWAARQAGAPIGDHGEGLGSVAGVTDWARRTGRLTSTPHAGDLILFGTRHIGIVESVNANGSVNTIEGNTSNMVARRHHGAGEATGYVRL
jgi:hypothetical protein